MASYSKASLERLQTADSRLQAVFQKVLDLGFDHSILCGWRSGVDQHDAFIRGCSKLDYPPGGNHNKTPSQAIDAQPYPAKENEKRWIQNQIFFAGVVVAVGKMMGYTIRWGGDWDQDRDLTDENGLIDFPHFEIKEG